MPDDLDYIIDDKIKCTHCGNSDFELRDAFDDEGVEWHAAICRICGVVAEKWPIEEPCSEIDLSMIDHCVYCAKKHDIRIACPDWIEFHRWRYMEMVKGKHYNPELH